MVCEEIPAGMGLTLCEMHNTDEIVSVRGGLPSEWPALPLSQVEVSPDESAGAVLLADLLLKSNLSMPPSPNRPGRSGSGPIQSKPFFLGCPDPPELELERPRCSPPKWRRCHRPPTPGLQRRWRTQGWGAACCVGRNSYLRGHEGREVVVGASLAPRRTDPGGRVKGRQKTPSSSVSWIRPSWGRSVDDLAARPRSEDGLVARSRSGDISISSPPRPRGP